MTPQERQMLGELFERIRPMAANPRDGEAEAFIAEATDEMPHAPYVLAQTALVQRSALDAAARRIQELEARLAAQSSAPSFLGDAGHALIGGEPAPPHGQAQQPVQAPVYAPPAGPWGASPAPGGGFLASAMSTATGVAGGMLAANAIEHLLLGGHALGGVLFGQTGFGAGGLGVGGLGAGETTINNFYDGAPGSAATPTDVSTPEVDQGGLVDPADYDSADFDDGSGGGGFDV
ncbi:MAG: DUF2076 domain-containing protein [Bradyrhizobium sp.]|nr:MAG: DUF2076 domain-containing protein [Bradyrhizobium sp.]